MPAMAGVRSPSPASRVPTGNCGVRYDCVFPCKRLTAMTTLLNALENADMLEIDGLHAFDFSLDEDDNLHIECMDGRALKRWTFSMAQIEAATFDSDLKSWVITGDSGEHRLLPLDAIGGDNDDEEDVNADA